MNVKADGASVAVVENRDVDLVGVKLTNCTKRKGRIATTYDRQESPWWSFPENESGRHEERRGAEKAAIEGESLLKK